MQQIGKQNLERIFFLIFTGASQSRFCSPLCIGIPYTCIYTQKRLKAVMCRQEPGKEGQREKVLTDKILIDGVLTDRALTARLHKKDQTRPTPRK
jgi:hypothetical protein